MHNIDNVHALLILWISLSLSAWWTKQVFLIYLISDKLIIQKGCVLCLQAGGNYVYCDSHILVGLLWMKCITDNVHAHYMTVYYMIVHYMCITCALHVHYMYITWLCITCALHVHCTQMSVNYIVNSLISKRLHLLPYSNTSQSENWASYCMALTTQVTTTDKCFNQEQTLIVSQWRVLAIFCTIIFDFSL